MFVFPFEIGDSLTQVKVTCAFFVLPKIVNNNGKMSDRLYNWK